MRGRIGVGDGGHVPQGPKIRGKYFFGQFYEKNSGILLIFHTYFSGKNFLPS